MAIPTYPDTIPGPKDCSYEPNEQVLTTQADIGPLAFRRRTRNLGSIDTISFKFFGEEYKIFVDWFRNTISYGHKKFLINLPSAGSLTWHICRFNEPPTTKLIGHGAWEVSGTIEVVERALNLVILPPPDPFLGFVGILMHGTAFDTTRKHALGVTAVTETAQTGALNPTALTFTGNSNQRLNILDNPNNTNDLNFSVPSWTFEWRGKRNLPGTGNPHAWFATQEIECVFNDNMIEAYAGTFHMLGSGPGISVWLALPGSVLNEFNSYAMTFNGTTLYGFINGKLVSTTSTTNPFWAKLIRMGTNGDRALQNGWPYPLRGAIEEVRFTRGVARYTADYTPATVPFPDPIV
jgi:hypothetical protein